MYGINTHTHTHPGSNETCREKSPTENKAHNPLARSNRAVLLSLGPKCEWNQTYHTGRTNVSRGTIAAN